MSMRSKSEAIRVIARFRRPSKAEKAEWNKYAESKWQREAEEPCSATAQVIKIDNPSTGRPYRFTYDEVLWTDVGQEETFNTVAAPACVNALNGFNGSVFAYGQTGAGKTHIMIGPEKKHGADKSGLVARAASFLLNAIDNSPDLVNEESQLRVSFLEIYKDGLRDLLPADASSYPELKIRQRLNSETFVENLHETKVKSLPQFLKLLQLAHSRRTMSAMSENKSSSRSHLIVSLYLDARKQPHAGGHKVNAKVNFVDLAGSEKSKKSGAVSSQRLKESAWINAGLSCLNRVVDALVKKRDQIPFRDSTLTWILKDSFAGNSKTCIVLATSPHQSAKLETIATCRFGAKCKMVKTRVIANKELTALQMKSILRKLQNENEELRDKLDGNVEITNDDVIDGYRRKIEDLQKKVTRYRRRGDEDELKENQSAAERSEYEERIQRLEAEVDNLSAQVRQSEEEKRQLAVMNALLAEKLDKSVDEIQNEQAITDLVRADLEYLQGDKNALLKQLREDLAFEDEGAQQLFEAVFEEMNKVAEELADREKDLEELEEKLEQSESAMEQRGGEIAKLKMAQTQLEKGGKKKRRKGDDDDDDDDEKDVELDSKLVRVDVAEQDAYLAEIAGKEQQVWEEREERAWRNFLNTRAKELGFKKGKELLKQRRVEAQQQVDEGYLEEVPEDDELLEDVRDDFYRLYDPATGEIRDALDVDEEMMGEQYVEEVDEMAEDDPFEWDERDVAQWLLQEGLPKEYAKRFKKEGVEGRVLLVDLNKTNLKRDLDVKGVHVDKLMRGIQELRAMSSGYDEWKIANGISDEDAGGKRGGGGGGLMKQGLHNIDDEFDVGADVNDGGDDDEDGDEFALTAEERQFGELFWAVDELFGILDIHKTGELDLATFKHGLHALQVELNDDEMDNVFSQIVGDDKSGNKKRMIGFKPFVNFLKMVDFLGPQTQKYAQDILSALPRVAGNRRQYVTRGAMVIKYGVRYNNSKREINNYLQNKGLNRAEIDAAWKQYRLNPKAIRDIDFKSLIGQKGKLIDMAIRDPDRVRPFDDYALYKLLKRAGFKGFGSKEFNDLDYLRAAGANARIFSIKCWLDPQSEFFNGLQVIYECTNREKLKGGRNMTKQGQYVEEEIKFQKNEVLCAVTVYFKHYVCGIRFVTNSRERLFGSDLGCTKTTLVAPTGTCIMAFYGSISRLFETLGCYVVVNENNARNAKAPQSGVQHLAVSAKQVKRHNSRNLNTNDAQEEEGGATTTQTNGGKKKRKKKRDKSSSYDDDYN